MKHTSAFFATFGILATASFAGTTASSDGFAEARRPISNPTLFDLALPTTNVHPIFMYQALPNRINTTAGNLPVGGDAEVYALQFEYALSDRVSIVATKDGYVDLNPDQVLSSEQGFANLGAGMKYAFVLDPASGTALSGTATFELPTGTSDVFQGEGGGAVNLMVSGLKLIDAWQFAAGAGVQIPFSDEQSTEGWISTHASYEVSKYFIPLVEVNWFHVLDSGNGTGNFPSQVGGNVPAVIKFEGGDLLNLGAANAGANRDFVSAAFGFRSRLTDCIDAGLAYEIPLTDAKDGLMDKRVTVDLVWKF